MKKPYLLRFAAVLVAAVFIISGCGYTTKSLLDPKLKTIYVENLVNKIKVTAESSDQRMYRSYRPGLELEASRAIRDKYLFDGNLKVVESTGADLTLKGELVDFRNEALRYDKNDNVQEYRIRIVVNVSLVNKDGSVRWTENDFAGESLYVTSGPMAKSETMAVADASADLARRIVERTIEEW